MKLIDNVKSKDMWPTTTYTFTVNDIDNEQIKNRVIEREQQGLGFRFDPVQGGGWQSNKDLLDEKVNAPCPIFMRKLVGLASIMLHQQRMQIFTLKTQDY